MIVNRCGFSMRSAAPPLDNLNGANGEISFTDMTGNSSHNNNNGNNSHYANSKNVNNSDSIKWSKAHDMQASSTKANPVLRNINNDMTKGLSRKSYKCKMQYNPNDRDAKQSNNDDLRMSKIMRRLQTETSPTVALELCAKLELAVRMPLNVGYLTRSFDSILDGMLSLFKQCPAPVLDECSKTLGLIGFINRMSYPLYEDFIIKNYRGNKRLQKYLIVALHTTLCCDTKCEMRNYSDKIMRMLKDFLETAESGENFMGISSCIVQFSHNYRDAFECHFTDVVDIIIGWQLEIGQPKELKSHCAYVLQQLTPYFGKHLEFSNGLLSQFIEDIAALDTMEHPGERIGAFIGAFNSLLKCLTRMRVRCESIVSVALSHLSNIMIDIKLLMADSSKDAVININELLCICLLNGYKDPDPVTLLQLINIQFQHIHKFNEQQQLSSLYLLLCTVRKLRTRLPAELVKLIFQADAGEQPFLANIRQQGDGAAHQLLLRTCQETLLIKNVPLLQQAYKQLVLHVDSCVLYFANPEPEENEQPPEDPDDFNDVSLLLIFHLAALSALAKQTSSIIGMYACKPSILELLINNCRAQDLSVWSKHASTHHAVLNLLVVHCKANHNFRNNSSLLRDEETESHSTSPTAHSFGTILKFLAQCLTQSAQLAPLNLKLLLQWTQTLLAECRTRSKTLLKHSEFIVICESIAGSTAKSAPLESAGCILEVLHYGTSRLKLSLLQLYRDTALHQLQSLNNYAHAAYAQIYAQLPLSLSLERRGALGIGTSHFCVWQQRLTQCTAVHDNVFRDFIERLQSPEQAQFADCLRGLFIRSCQLMPLDDRQEKLTQCTRRCQRLAAAWLQFEAARYCVDQKLRTTLGKPQDTFLAFEAIIMRYARLLTGCAKEGERLALNKVTTMQLTNARTNLTVLLGFLDALEKLIYNAAEGSAFALRPPEKSVNAFFRLNNSTCQSWFNRIRIGVVIIATHSQQPELVIRYAQQILQTHKSQDCAYSQAIVYLAGAFIKCKESDSLRGLYVWARSKFDKSYQWLQYAADQAAGRKELAATGYQSVLADQQNELEPHTRQFVFAQLIDCLQSTGQWVEAVNVRRPDDTQTQLNPFLQQTNSLSNELDKLLARRMSPASDELNAALHDLTLWPDENNENEEHVSFSSVYMHGQLENVVLQQALNENAAGCQLDKAKQQLMDVNWRECLLNASCDQSNWQHLTLLKHISQNLNNHDQQLSLLPLHNSKNSGNSISTAVMLRCVAWTQLLRNRCNMNSLGTLYLDTAMVAREEGNQQTCQAMLELYFGQPMTNVARQLLAHQLDVTNGQVLRGYSELVKCLHLQQQHQLQCNELSSINVCANLCLSIQKQQQQQQQQQLQIGSSIGAELQLTLSDWLTVRSCSGLSTNLSPSLQELLEQLPECPLTRCTTAQPLVLSQGERLVARLINASLQQRPNNEEALIAYGNWCYRWGKKIVDCGTVLKPTDLTAIGDVLGAKQPLDDETLQELLLALRMEHQPGSNNCEEDELQTDAQYELRLRKVQLLANKPAGELEAIVRIWRRAISNTFDYYKEAARAYFHYLSLKPCNLSGIAAAPMQQPSQRRFHVDDNNMVTTTLRLLRLIVKHASGLQEVLEQGLKTTPIGPWKVIIPQLFSRLNHHEPYVRKSVCALLCRLAESRPQLVTFPAVVGANRELQATPIASSMPAMDVDAVATTFDSTRNSNYNNNYNNNNNNNNNSSSYACLLGALTKQAPEVVEHVQLLVKELRRVCLLWDEYWIHSLAHIYNAYSGRVNGMANDFKPDDHEGKQNRFNTWRPQLLNDLEALMAFTSREPETNYERSFKRRFDAPINSAVEALRHQPYPEAWDQLKQLYHVFQANMLRGSSTTLKMQNISPVLFNIGRNRISMPGLDAQDEQQSVYIESVDSVVCILPTKTKPKKVVFYGSNGQKYTFLFKGLEDLHLDERIMQFLSISNAIMACKTDTPSCCYRAHHYSVIPLGPQSGLISWVDGVTPLFALYKKWQQRQPQQSTNASSRRLTDLYYNKLSPLLAKHNMRVTDPRRQWPLPALQQVLRELIQETPSDLLARELWCQAGSPAEWRQSVRRYTMCMAVMSVIGYIIGLGDRHLDNVLINLSSGDIVHIDYNVCFEKGRTLRIPERVPFRLTQNMIHAFGVTGVEGGFRLGCEYVLKAMRKERETLLTLLEAFVYDPLVDWTINDDTAAMRRAINAKPTDSTATEIKCYKKEKSKNKQQDWDARRRNLLGKLKQCQKFWTKYKMEILPQLSDVGKEIDKLQQIQTKRLSAEHELMELNQRSALIAEINSLGTAIESHSFNTASTRYAAKRQNMTELANQAPFRQLEYARVQSLLQRYGQCLEQHHLGSFNMRFIQFKMEGSSWHNEYMTLMEMRVLLPANTLDDYDRMRSQLDEHFGHFNDLGLQCLEHLMQYAAIMSYYPVQRQRRNVYMRFNDTYASHLKNVDNLNMDQAIDAESKMIIAETMVSAWLEFNCQLHQLNQQFGNEQVIVQTQTSSNSLLAVILQSGYDQLLLGAALIRTLDNATTIFNGYEQSALASQNVKLLTQQLQFIQLVRTMCQSIMEPIDHYTDHLSELQDALSALLQLQHCFEYELPNDIYRLLSKSPNLDGLLQLNAERLSTHYIQAVTQQQQQPTLPLTVEQQFLVSLQNAFEQFEQLSDALQRIVSTINLVIDTEQSPQAQQYAALNIRKIGNNQLHVHEFFELVLQTLHVSGTYDVRLMAKPVLGFVHRLQTDYIVGLVALFSYAYYSSYGTPCQQLAGTDLAQDAQQLSDNIFAALQAETSLPQLQCDISLLSQQIESQTLVAAAHNWAYGELFDREVSCDHILSRRKLCEIIYGNWQTLNENAAQMQQLLEALDGQMIHVESQRSNWNRNHIDSLVRNEQLQRRLTNDQIGIFNELSKYISALCTVEQIGVFGEEQQEQLANMEQWLQAFDRWQESNARISAVEQAIVQLLDPEGPIDQYWLRNVQGLLEDYTCKVQREIATLEGEQQASHGDIFMLFKEVQRQQEHMPRIYLRNLCTEFEDPNQTKVVPLDIQLLCGHVRDAQLTLSNFFQRLSEFRKDLSTEKQQSLLPSTLTNWQQQLQYIQQMASDDVDEFFRSVDEFLQHAADGDLLSYETFTHSKGAPNLHEQKRNAYGVSVWKKIRMKLEGRDPDSNHRSTVAEQVDYAIHEATNPDNLAVLYEGWTPWV